MLVDAALQLITGLAQGLIVALPVLIAQAPTLITSLVSAIVANIPLILSTGVQIIGELIAGIAGSLGDLGTAAGDIINTLLEGLAGLVGNLASIGADVVEQIKTGISNAWDGLVSFFKGLWNSLFGGLSVNVGVSGGGGGKPAASGINYVPRNNFPVLAHEGEAILTASEAKAWRKGNGGGNGVVINQYINAPAQTPVQLASATAAYFEQARWAI